MERFLCVHGHFYQPPRENPWLEAVEIEDGAYPYHDWNERITAECYATNSASRILDNKMRIMDIVSNYAKISFDMGPTLLSWLEKNSPEIYNAIVESDRLSIKWRSGHGAAIAQAYNHIIMPLANSRDKKTQVIWGIKDFEYRFKRSPEGMWLPETAVDLETLDILASMGIRFTILAPHQANRTRKIGSRHWEDASNGNIDTTMPYICNLPSGQKITIFFYDSNVSHAVAFERLLDNGEEFARRLLSGFSEQKQTPQLMHIATDGESYGHHHRFGDMALAYALHYIESNGFARITNYGEYLEKHPPTHEVEIFENTSWSCVHGVERWKSNCGCNTGAYPHWNQQWRTPLRETFDWLRDKLSLRYEKTASKYFKDPWAARDDYINVILDRSEKNLAKFFKKHTVKPLSHDEQVAAIKLLEMQRHAMLMYTSCGWFFEELSGIETVQVMKYAGRAVQLAEELFGNFLEKDFIKRLKAAKSNIPEHKDGALIYEKFVKPCIVNLKKVGVHYAVSSLFNEYPEKTTIYCYEVENQSYQKTEAGRAQIVTGRCLITSEITRESEVVCFSVLHLGNHDFNCGVHRYIGEEACNLAMNELHNAFENGAFADVVRLMDTHFGMHNYSLKDLFKDEQRNILETLLRETMDNFEAAYRRLYEENRILMSFLQETGIPIPKAFYTAAEFILNLDMKRQLQAEVDTEKTQNILKEFQKWKVSPNAVELEFILRHTLAEEMKKLLENPFELSILENVERIITIASSLPFETNFWTVQNIYYRMAKTIYADFVSRAAENTEALAWVERFRSIGQKLNFNLDSVLSTS
jgi:alpha-amylase/alpha-mannosidase (GH57 family)